MRLGISSSLKHDNPADWAKKQTELGCRAVVFPVDSSADESLIQAYVVEANKNDLRIAEVGVWRNTLSADPAERKKAIEYACAQLALADRIGANCCVNMVGTSGGPVWDGGYASNYSKENWNESVNMIRQIIDEVKPKNTVYSIEPMPWMIPTGPEEYLRLIDAVERDAFGVHMDMVNMINSPERYFFMDEFIDKAFELLGNRICSCHLKDIHLTQELTFQLKETFCGNGEFPIRRYLDAAQKANPEMPMIIEHLEKDDEYISSMRYIQGLMEA